MIMKKLSKAMCAALVTAGVAAGSACFSDPTSDLRNGPARIEISNSVIVQRVGQTDQVDISVVDEQGNDLPFGEPTFTSLTPAVATLAPLADSLLRRNPGNTIYKSTLTALESGTALIVVAVSGLEDTIQVYVLPNQTGGEAVANSVFGANSEVTVTAPPATTFNTTGTVTTAACVTPALTTNLTVTSRTATTLTAISPTACTGVLVLRNLSLATQAVDSIVGGTITLPAATFSGAVAVGTSAAFGTNTLLTVTAPAGTSFSTTTPAPVVTVGTTACTAVTIAAATLTCITGANATGVVNVTNLISAGGLPIHAIASTAPAVTIVRASFVGAAVTVGDSPTYGTGTLITVPALAGTEFAATGAPTPTVTVNATAATVVSRTATTVTAIVGANIAAVTTVTVGNLTAGGRTLPALIDTVAFAVNRAQFTGAATVGNGPLGANTVLTLVAPAGHSFTGSPGVAVGTNVGAVLSGGTTNTITAIFPQAITATAPTITGVVIGAGGTGIALPALLGSTAVTVAASAFPGTVSTPGTLLTPIEIKGGASARFGANSLVTFNTTPARAAIVLRRHSDTMITVLAPVPGTATFTITNVVVGGATVSQLTTAGTTTVTATTGETGEPSNDNMLTSVTLTPDATFDTLFGALTPGTDGNDFFKVVLAAPGIIEAFLDFPGTGSGTAPNPDIDVYVTRDVNGNGAVDAADLCNEFGGSFAEADCAGATAAQPEHETTKLLPAGTYFINVELFLAGGVTTPMSYRLRYRIP